MAFDFPDTPTLNQIISGPGGIQYRFDGVKWVAYPAAVSYAPLVSPVFTGDPKAPTPAAGDNDTSLATTAFVASSFAPINNPIFTGDPRAPTPAVGDNDTSIATTAFAFPRVGVSDGSNAAAGQVGEYLTATASGVAQTNGIAMTVTSLSLTAGDWDVEGAVAISSSTAALIIAAGWVSTTANTMPPGGSLGNATLYLTSGALATTVNLATGAQRFNVTTTTTVYLGGQANFNTGTTTAAGTIRARRKR